MPSLEPNPGGSVTSDPENNSQALSLVFVHVVSTHFNAQVSSYRTVSYLTLKCAVTYITVNDNKKIDFTETYQG